MKMWKTKHIYIKTSSPPWSISCSEISFNPWNKHNFSIINICMCQSQGLFQIVENIIFVSTQQIKKKKEKKNTRICSYQRSRTPNNSALIVVLRAVAWTNELVLCCIPWHNTSQMCAHSIYTIGSQCSFIFDYQVGRISLRLFFALDVS